MADTSGRHDQAVSKPSLGTFVRENPARSLEHDLHDARVQPLPAEHAEVGSRQAAVNAFQHTGSRSSRRGKRHGYDIPQANKTRTQALPGVSISLYNRKPRDKKKAPISRGFSTGGQGEIRTPVARSAAGLQPAAIVHSATYPSLRDARLILAAPPGLVNCSLRGRGHEAKVLGPRAGLEPATFRLQGGSSTN